MIFRQLFDRESCTYTYLLGDEGTREAVLIDTVREHVARDVQLVSELELRLGSVLETHVHADHVTGASELRRLTGARTYVSRDGGAPCADVCVANGDRVRVGQIELQVLATPGHTEGCVSYLVGENGVFDRVFTGDALLIRGCGRTDFQGGSAQRLYRSVHETIFALPEATLVYPAHDYGGRTVSTVQEERRYNPRLMDRVPLDAFVKIMSELNLPPPAKLAIAVTANRACGDLAAPNRQG